MTDSNKMTQAEAIVTLANTIAEASKRKHLDWMTDHNELWHCPSCDRYFTYFNEIPIVVDAIIGKQHFMCRECYSKLNSRSNGGSEDMDSHAE